MPARLTTRAQVNGYRFLLRRLEHALIRRDSRMIHDPMRSQVRAMLVGFVICVLVVGACAALAIFKPSPSLGNSTIITSQSSGALYVRFNNELHPVLNLTSARLIAGKPDNPAKVKDSDLGSLPAGPTLGIIGAPSSIAKADDLSRSDWSVCDSQTRSGDDTSPFRTETVVLSSVPKRSADIDVAPAGSAAIAADSDGHYFLLYDGKRAQIDPTDPVLVNALKITGASTINASAGLLGSFRAVAPIGRIVIPEAGRPSQLSFPEPVKIGSIVKSVESGGTRQYVVLADGIAPVSDATADIIRFSNPGLLGDAVEMPPATLNSLPQSASMPVDTTDYPAQVPHFTLGGYTTICTHWSAPSLSQDPTVEMLVGNRLPIGADARPTALVSADGDGPNVDATYIPPGTGEFVQAAGQGRVAGQLFYISDTGLRYPIPDPKTADALGVFGVRSADGKQNLPQLAPWNVVSLLPAGPTLSTDAALIAHGGYSGDAAAVPTSPSAEAGG
ncbi:type VII secretion protein EccB [Gordonia sp. DT30]|uniref:type VII secretion protein EccB n=1 Tax=unclassified Gordonia (in: high G+C Gram-positive bacteria) TaxID=2657482 RepID=UPI003CF21910